MRKYIVLLSLLLCIIMFLLVACSDNQGGNVSVPDNSQTENNSSIDDSNKSQNTDNALSLQLNIEGQIDGNKILIKVPNNITEYSFINAFTFSDKYRWELHWDKSGISDLNIVSKTVNLDEGDNILYALFIDRQNSDNVILFEICVHRVFNASVTYAILSTDEKTIYKRLTYSDIIPTLTNFILRFEPDLNDFEDGFCFGGYYDISHNSILQINIREDTTVLIRQKARSYTITLDPNGGILASNIIPVQYKSEYSLPVPLKTDYRFIGWYYDNDSVLLQENGIWLINQSILAKARWETIYNTYTGTKIEAYDNELLKSLVRSEGHGYIEYTKNSLDEDESIIRCSVSLNVSANNSLLIKELKDLDLNIVGKVSPQVNYLTQKNSNWFKKTGYFTMALESNAPHITFSDYGEGGIGIGIVWEFKQKDLRAVVESQGFQFESVGIYTECAFGVYGTIIYIPETDS